MSTQQHEGRIDVHHHLVPPVFRAEMERRGLDQVAGAPLPRWEPQQSLALMDDNGIDSAILSLSAPGVYFGDLAAARSLARASNEYAAALHQAHPRRFGFFAVLPMPFAHESCLEASYALDELGADGVILLGSTEGHFLGDPRLEELMAELDRRAATVFVHPNLHASSTQLGLPAPGFLIEFLCDTTRAALNLILSGTMERYPRIRFILSHSGGFLPFVAWRVTIADHFPQFREKAPQGVLHYVKQFYYDTALSPSNYSLAALRELVPASQILFGSDFPFATPELVALQRAMLDRSTLLDAPTRAAAWRGNAEQLFPRFATLR
jgi:predicted TIM-barrel fold metal-dependent hydrolase